MEISSSSPARAIEATPLSRDECRRRGTTARRSYAVTKKYRRASARRILTRMAGLPKICVGFRRSQARQRRGLELFRSNAFVRAFDRRGDGYALCDGTRRRVARLRGVVAHAPRFRRRRRRADVRSGDSPGRGVAIGLLRNEGAVLAGRSARSRRSAARVFHQIAERRTVPFCKPAHGRRFRSEK